MSVENTSSTACPDWCNRQHKPGANPRRISHEHKFRPTRNGSSGVGPPLRIGDRVYPKHTAWITTYPAPTSHDDVGGPVAILDFAAYGRDLRMCLSLDDLRDLVSDLRYMADILAAEQALIDARKVGVSA